jgi:hypothetical protein
MLRRSYVDILSVSKARFLQIDGKYVQEPGYPTMRCQAKLCETVFGSVIRH